MTEDREAKIRMMLNNSYLRRLQPAMTVDGPGYILTLSNSPVSEEMSDLVLTCKDLLEIDPALAQQLAMHAGMMRGVI